MGETHPSSMTVCVRLFLGSVIRKVATMTLNAIFSAVKTTPKTFVSYPLVLAETGHCRSHLECHTMHDYHTLYKKPAGRRTQEDFWD